MKTDRQQRALKIIYDYWKTNEAYPSNVDMVKFLSDIKDANEWGNTRRAMIKNGKLIESLVWDFELSDEVLANLRANDKRAQEVTSFASEYQPDGKSHSTKTSTLLTKTALKLIPASGSVQPGDIPIYGQVRAGTDRGPDDLVIDLSSSGDTLNILDVDDSRPIFALEVQGRSMVSDSILPNDFVIVERVSFPEIKDGDLIVAKYLKEEFNRINDLEMIDAALDNPNNYDGPTLKYFRRLPVKAKLANGQEFEEVRYQLAPKNKDPHYTVITRHIVPDDLGRVISVHRLIRKI